MTDRRHLEVIAGLLALVDARKGDQWWEACCSGCYDEPWHGGGRYGDEPPTTRNETTEAVAMCECACHSARAVLRETAPELDPHDLRDPVADRRRCGLAS